MDDDSAFIMRIIIFGLSEKEARLYLHLLKYGLKPSDLLPKSLKSCREDIYRTLGSVTEKGVVNPSLDSPTVYAAVDIKTPLDTTLKKFENELREMEMTICSLYLRTRCPLPPDMAITVTSKKHHSAECA